MRILALDPAVKCGFAYGELEDLTTGTWDLSVKKDESKGMRLIRLRSKLNTLREIGIGVLVYEAARAAGGHMGPLVVQSEFQGVIKVWAEDAGIEYRGYSSTEIKKFATGKGNAKKPEMINAAIHKFGVDVLDDNEADALALWHLAWSEYGEGGIPPEPAKTKPKPRKRKDKAKEDA